MIYLGRTLINNFFFPKIGSLNINNNRMFEKKTLKKSPKSQKQEQKEIKEDDRTNKQRLPINFLVQQRNNSNT